MKEDLRQLLERTLAPLRERRAEVERELQQLLAQVEEKRGEIREIDRLLRYDPRVAPKATRKKEKPRTASVNSNGEEKRYPGTSVSDEKVEKVLETLRRLGRPAGTREVFEETKVPLTQSSVGKLLGDLANTNVIRRAGVMQGVRGHRPMYALWPEGTSTNGGGDHT